MVLFFAVLIFSSSPFLYACIKSGHIMLLTAVVHPSVPFTFVFATPWGGGGGGIFIKLGSHCGDVHIATGCCPMFFKGVGALGFSRQNTSSQLLVNLGGGGGGGVMKLSTKKDHNVEICILQGKCCLIFF